MAGPYPWDVWGRPRRWSSSQRNHEQALLDLSHVFLRLSLAQPVLDEAGKLALLNLARCLRDEPRRRVLKHHRLQREAARPLPALNQAAAAQPVQGFEHHLHRSLRRAEDSQQLLQAHRLAQDGQPREHRLLERREAVEVLVEQLAHPPKDHLALRQERGDLASEELEDGLRHDLQGQRIAPVHLY